MLGLWLLIVGVAVTATAVLSLDTTAVLVPRLSRPGSAAGPRRPLVRLRRGVVGQHRLVVLPAASLTDLPPSATRRTS